MKRILPGLLVALALLVSGTVNAQAKKTPEEQAKKMTAKMTENLSLTPEQAQKAEVANLEFTKALHEARANKDSAAVEKAVARHDEQLSAFLSPEQLQKFRENKKKRKDKMSGPMKRRKMN